MIGIDEVGRGAWAGPLLVVAARATGPLPEVLTDSKLMTAKSRISVIPQLLNSCDFGEGWVSAQEIDILGLADAMRLAVNRCLSALPARSDEAIVMDGSVNYCPVEFRNVQCIIKADRTHPVVSAASVYAKVTRDAFMQSLDNSYTGYDFSKHVGYGTALHKSALLRHGVSNQHRKSFKPIRALL